MVANEKTPGQRLERRLAAIVAADVVGYSKMMGADEAGTYRALQKQQRELFFPAIARYSGKIFKTMGDGVLAEFSSIVDAVACSVMVQRAMLSRNVDIPQNRRIVLRIGVNLGDVIIEGADVFGDGVNVAARLEAICEPGGVMISGAVYEQVRAKLPYTFEALGERQLKNIVIPVAVFGLSPAALAESPEIELPEALPAPIAESEKLAEVIPSRWRSGLVRIVAGLAVILLVGAAVGLGLMINTARKSQSILVDQFDSPPTLAAQGMSGKVVARGVLDELVRLQAATRSSAEKRSLSNFWTGEIKVEAPEGGLSLKEIDRILRTYFGHDLHIDGELVQVEKGRLVLSVRGNGVQSKTFTGAAGELGKLATQSAEYIYGESQPALFAFYLIGAGRLQEAENFSKAALAKAPDSETPFILNAWGTAIEEDAAADLREALPPLREALRLKPDYWSAYHNISEVYASLGDEEDAWRTIEGMRQVAGGRPGAARELAYHAWDILTRNLLTGRNAVIEDASRTTIFEVDPTQIAAIDILLHDIDDAEFQLQRVKDEGEDPFVTTGLHLIRADLAAEAGDTKMAAAEIETMHSIELANPAIFRSFGRENCTIAQIEEAAANRTKADEALGSGGTYVNCYRFKADILDGRGDWPAAQKAYQAAVELAPDLPIAYYSWGMALARHGDNAAAKDKLIAANRRGPHWADPLKAWGDILAKEGNWRDALAKYDVALQYAPAWAELHKARDEATRRLR